VDVFPRDEADQVDDEAVLLKDQEMDVGPADAGDRPAYGLVREHRRALLRQLEDKDAGDRAARPGPAKEAADAPEKRQDHADGHADPPVNPLERARFAAESFQGRDAGWKT
jgi:hypothetical protein